MYLLRKWGYYHRKMRRGDFTRPTELMSDEIFNQTVGIVGLGRIGAAAAEMYHALGARVIGYDPVYNASLEPFLDFVDFETLIKESDIVQVHIPLTPENKGMFSANEFAKMKDDAILVNQSRGELVDTAALIVALKYHEIGGAAKRGHVPALCLLYQDGGQEYVPPEHDRYRADPVREKGLFQGELAKKQ